MSRRVGTFVSVFTVVVSLVPFAHVLAQSARPPLTAADLLVVAALDDRASLDFDDQPLSDVAESLRQKHKVKIQLDYKALTDAGIGSDTPVSIHLSDVSLRSALRLVLGQLDLTYLVRDGYLLITSKTESENTLQTKVYPVGDLVANNADLCTPLTASRIGTTGYQELIDIISATIDPTTWDEVGGPGAVQEVPAAKALVISQTQEGHEDIARLLAVLRRVREVQTAAAKAVARPAPNKPGEPAWTVKVYRLVPNLAKGVLGGAGGLGMGGGMFALDDATGQEAKDAGAPPANQPAAAPGPANPPASSGPAKVNLPTIAADADQIDAWAKEIAVLLPQLIAPETWQAPGKGTVHAAAGTIIVRQTEDVHQQIGQLLKEIVPENLAKLPPINQTSARLAVPGPQANWPSEAEPIGINRDAELARALEQKVDLEPHETPLGDLFDAIGETYHLPLFIDHKALTDAGVGADAPITRDLRGLTLRAALRLVLNDLDLAYIFQNEVVVITSKTEAENMLEYRVYPVFDLVVRSSEAPPIGPATDYGSLIQSLTSTIARATWDEVGGPGSIKEFSNSGVLVISQTTEAHEEIAGFLQALREVGAARK